MNVMQRTGSADGTVHVPTLVSCQAPTFLVTGTAYFQKPFLQSHCSGVRVCVCGGGGGRGREREGNGGGGARARLCACVCVLCGERHLNICCQNICVLTAYW